MFESGSKQLTSTTFGAASVVFFLLTALFLKQICFIEHPNIDQGIIPLGADMVARGGLIYRDFDILHWPGSYFLLALIFKLFGSTWFVCRSVLMVEIMIMAAIILYLSRQALSSWLVFMPPTLFIVLGPPHSNYNYHHWDTLLFFLGYIVLLTASLKKQRIHWLWPFLSGLLAAFSALCFQPFGLAALITLFAFAIIHARLHQGNKDTVRFCLLFASGFAAPLLSVAIYLIAIDDFVPMLQCTVAFVFLKYSQVNIVQYGHCSFFDRAFFSTAIIPGQEVFAITKLILSSLCWLPHELTKDCPFLLAAISIPVVSSKRLFSQVFHAHPQVVLWFASGFALWITELHRAELARLFWGSQLLMIVLFFAFEKILDFIPPLGLALRISLFILLMGVFVNIALVEALYSSAHQVIATRRGAIRCLQNLSIVPKLMQLTKPNDPILIYPWEPIIYYLSQTTPPSRCAYLQYNYHSQEDFRRTIDAMEKTKLPYVVWDMSLGNDTFADSGFPSYKAVPRQALIMESYLRSHYDFVKVYGAFRLLKRKDSPLCAPR